MKKNELNIFSKEMSSDSNLNWNLDMFIKPIFKTFLLNRLDVSSYRKLESNINQNIVGYKRGLRYHELNVNICNEKNEVSLYNMLINKQSLSQIIISDILEGGNQIFEVLFDLEWSSLSSECGMLNNNESMKEFFSLLKNNTPKNNVRIKDGKIEWTDLTEEKFKHYEKIFSNSFINRILLNITKKYFLDSYYFYKNEKIKIVNRFFNNKKEEFLLKVHLLYENKQFEKINEAFQEYGENIRLLKEELKNHEEKYGHFIYLKNKVRYCDFLDYLSIKRSIYTQDHFLETEFGSSPELTGVDFYVDFLMKTDVELPTLNSELINAKINDILLLEKIDSLIKQYPIVDKSSLFKVLDLLSNDERENLVNLNKNGLLLKKVIGSNWNFLCDKNALIYLGFPSRSQILFENKNNIEIHDDLNEFMAPYVHQKNLKSILSDKVVNSLDEKKKKKI